MNDEVVGYFGDPEIGKGLIGEREVFVWRKRMVARLQRGVRVKDVESAFAERVGVDLASVATVSKADANRIILIKTREPYGAEVPNKAARDGHALFQWVEPDTVVRGAMRWPDDPDMPAPGGSGDWGLRECGFPVAWDVETAANDMRVTTAVLDGGVPLDKAGNLTHQDLQLTGRMTLRQNYVTTESWDDTSGHGTKTLGIIAANQSNSFGMPGINFGGRILNYKVLDANNNGSVWDVYAAVWDAMWQSYIPGRRLIINMSLQGPPSAITLSMAWMSSYWRFLIVGSSGNYEASDTDTHIYPVGDGLSTVAAPAVHSTAYRTVMGVGAAHPGWTVAPWSRRGSGVTVVAPGESVLTTIRDSPWTTNASFGTSIAAPFVTGLASLIWAQDPSLRAGQVRSIIELTAREHNISVFDATSTPVVDPSAYGKGRIDAAAALAVTELRRLNRLPTF